MVRKLRESDPSKEHLEIHLQGYPQDDKADRMFRVDCLTNW